MTKEEIDFLKQLQHEMNTQDKNSQRDPRFWVVRGTQRDYGIQEDFHHDGVILYIDCDTQINEIVDCVEYLNNFEYQNDDKRFFIFDEMKNQSSFF